MDTVQGYSCALSMCACLPVFNFGALMHAFNLCDVCSRLPSASKSTALQHTQEQSCGRDSHHPTASWLAAASPQHPFTILARNPVPLPCRPHLQPRAQPPP